MNTALNREELINQVFKARVKGIVIPSNFMGTSKKVFVKTSKHDLVAMIRHEFQEGQPTNLRMRIEKGVAIVESVRSQGNDPDLPPTLTGVADLERPRRGRGRPKATVTATETKPAKAKVKAKASGAKPAKAKVKAGAKPDEGAGAGSSAAGAGEGSSGQQKSDNGNGNGHQEGANA
jgi:hypothetical protein